MLLEQLLSDSTATKPGFNATGSSCGVLPRGHQGFSFHTETAVAWERSLMFQRISSPEDFILLQQSSKYCVFWVKLVWSPQALLSLVLHCYHPCLQARFLFLLHDLILTYPGALVSQVHLWLQTEHFNGLSWLLIFMITEDVLWDPKSSGWFPIPITLQFIACYINNTAPGLRSTSRNVLLLAFDLCPFHSFSTKEFCPPFLML